MADYTALPSAVFRDHQVEGDPGSGRYEPDKGAVRTLLNEILDAIDVNAAFLAALVAATFNSRGAWLTATAYAVNDVVTESDTQYLCVVAHTSGVFADDLAANKWVAYEGSSEAVEAAANLYANISVIAANNSAAINAISDPAFNITGAWLTSTAYAVNDTVEQNGVEYLCIVAHTSGVFADDLAAAKWVARNGSAEAAAAAKAYYASFFEAVDLDGDGAGRYNLLFHDVLRYVIFGVTKNNELQVGDMIISPNGSAGDVAFLDAYRRGHSLADMAYRLSALESPAAAVFEDFSIRIDHPVGDVVFTDTYYRGYSLADISYRLSALENGTGVYAGFTASEIAAFDGQALAESNAVAHNGVPSLAAFTPGYRHVIEYGQSFSVGALGHPRRTKTQLYDALMLGDSVRPSNLAATFAPFGGVSELKSLNVTVEGPGSTRAILDAGTVASLDWDDSARGETAGAGFADFAKKLHNANTGAVNDGDRRFVVTSTGHGGQNIAQLSKDAPGNSEWFFDRSVDAAGQIKAIADTDTVGSGVACYLYQQGQADVDEATDKATYKAAVLQLRDDLHDDIQSGVYGQADNAPFLLTQTSGDWTDDATDYAVSEAQLEMGLEQPDMFLAAPEYFVTTKPDHHPDANGYRWLGMFFAKVYYRVAILRQGWQPLHIKKAYRRAKSVLLIYHVPAPPLQFRSVYNVHTAEMYADKGFKIVDSQGTIPLSSVTISGEACISINLSRTPIGACTLIYAGEETFGGRGNVADSDAMIAPRNYEYLPADGDIASVNIAELVDKPYPLNNMAVQQKITIIEV